MQDNHVILYDYIHYQRDLDMSGEEKQGRDAERDQLKKRIIEEMTVDYANALARNFDLAKQFIRLSENGEVEVLIKEKLTGLEKILLYLVGKLYAKEAGLAPTDDVGNSELVNNLQMPSGSLLPWLKSLRDDNRIKQTTREGLSYHSIPLNQVERVLQEIARKHLGSAEDKPRTEGFPPFGGFPATSRSKED
jgi:hypothetical protein